RRVTRCQRPHLLILTELIVRRREECICGCDASLRRWSRTTTVSRGVTARSDIASAQAVKTSETVKRAVACGEPRLLISLANIKLAALLGYGGVGRLLRCLSALLGRFVLGLGANDGSSDASNGRDERNYWHVLNLLPTAEANH